MDVPGYEHYPSAVAARSAARLAATRATADITDYAEHKASREQMQRAGGLLADADREFAANRFEASARLANEAAGQIARAHDHALDYKRQVLVKKEAETRVILDRLENALGRLPGELPPGQQALRSKAAENLRLGRQFQEEGGWGFAQMHGIIGYRQVEAIGGGAAPGSTP
jgi:hypothetical protein